MDEQWQCPRRKEVGAWGHDHPFRVPAYDTWLKDGDWRICSWCGSTHPEDCLAYLRNKGKFFRADGKDYKLYLDLGMRQRKVYMQHFTQDHFREFDVLTNATGRNLQ